jgi:hypothetical protein
MVTGWAPCELLFAFCSALSSKFNADVQFQLPKGVTHVNGSMFKLSAPFIKSLHA